MRVSGRARIGTVAAACVLVLAARAFAADAAPPPASSPSASQPAAPAPPDPPPPAPGPSAPPQAASPNPSTSASPPGTSGPPASPAPVPPAAPIPMAAPSVEILRSGSGRMRGEVSFNRQEPVAGADVVLMREGDPGRLCVGVTDTNGYFRFESIEEGNWTVGIVREGAVPFLKTGIPVRPPARGVVDAVLQKSETRFDPPLFDLSQYETGASPAAGQASGSSAGAPPTSGSAGARTADGLTGSSGASAVPPAPGGTPPGMKVQVFDGAMMPVREARVSLRSRGPRVDPLRGSTDGRGIVSFPDPAPGEYVLRVEVPGFLPARVDRLKLGRTAPVVTAVLTARPLDYPAKPSELLPEEKPVPPVGFPGSPENQPPPPPVQPPIAPSREPSQPPPHP